MSYAREDSEAARRIADALRAAGVEVWFDQQELRGGDEWDARIRKQIRECALFVPVISRHTEERGEGYFRLEWDLAEERTHLIAKGVPFLLPLAIDNTPEAQALVPERFRSVQWLRLTGAVSAQRFVEQVKVLLERPRSGYTAPPWQAPANDPVPTSVPRAAEPARHLAASKRKAWILAGSAACGAVAAVAVFLSLRPASKIPAHVETSRSHPVPKTATETPRSLLSDKSIAVLPFANLSEDKDASAFFADGVHDDILANLVRIRELRVVSRTSVMEYRGRNANFRQIGDKLGVVYILEGSVRRAGNRVRVIAQLIRAATDEYIWAETFERDLTDVFAIQSELAQKIATSLHAVLSPQERKLLAHRPTENSAAYDLYLQARDPKASLPKQEALFQAAVTLDQKFAEAWGELARAHARIHFQNIEHTPARLAKATQAIEMAMGLSPDSPEVIRNVGNYYLYGHRNYARATEQFERLARLQPNNSEVYFSLGEIQQRQAQWAAAVTNFRRATQLDPGNASYALALFELLRGGRRWDEAITAWRRVTALRSNQPRDRFLIALMYFQATGSRREVEEFFAALTSEESASPPMISLRLDWARQSGNYAEAIRLQKQFSGKIPRGNFDLGFAEALTLMATGETSGARALMANRVAAEKARLEKEPSNTDALWQLGLAHAVLGEKTDALRCARRVADLIPESFDAVAGATTGNKLSLIYAWAGETDLAIQEAGRLLQTPYSVTSVQFMKHDPWWFPLRNDPRFEALLNDPKNNAPLF